MKWWTILLAVVVGLNVASAFVTIRSSVDESANCKDRFKGRIEYSSDCQPASKNFIKKIHEGFLRALYKFLSATGGGLSIDFTPKSSPREIPSGHHGKPQVKDAQTETNEGIIEIPIYELTHPENPNHILESKFVVQPQHQQPDKGSNILSGWLFPRGHDQQKHGEGQNDGDSTVNIQTDYPVTSSKGADYGIPGKKEEPKTKGQQENPPYNPFDALKSGSLKQSHFRHFSKDLSNIAAIRPNTHGSPLGENDEKLYDLKTSGSDAHSGPFRHPSSVTIIDRDPDTRHLTRLIPVDPHSGKPLSWSNDFDNYQEPKEPGKTSFDGLNRDEYENPFLTSHNEGGETEDSPSSDSILSGKDIIESSEGEETVIKRVPSLYDPSKLPGKQGPGHHIFNAKDIKIPSKPWSSGVPSGIDTKETPKNVETVIERVPLLYDPSKLPSKRGPGHNSFENQNPWSSQPSGHKTPSHTDDPFQTITSEEQDTPINISPKSSHHDSVTITTGHYPFENKKPWSSQPSGHKTPSHTDDPFQTITSEDQDIPINISPKSSHHDSVTITTGHYPFENKKPWSSQPSGHKTPSHTDDPFQTITSEEQDIPINISPKSSHHAEDDHQTGNSDNQEPRQEKSWITEEVTPTEKLLPHRPPCGQYCCQPKVPTPICACQRT